MKRLNKKRIVLFVILVLILVGVGIVLIPKLTKKEKGNDEGNTVKVENEIEAYGYKLIETKSKLYKDYFKDLESVLTIKEDEEVDEEKYASVIVKLFVADFYDLNGKTTKNDVGGTQFVYDKALENFLINAKDTIYKYVENNLSGDRTQELPSVLSVTVDSIEKTSFTYNADNITDENAYKVKATIEYESDLGYQKEVTITLAHQDKKLVIVEVK